MHLHLCICILLIPQDFLPEFYFNWNFLGTEGSFYQHTTKLNYKHNIFNTLKIIHDTLKEFPKKLILSTLVCLHLCLSSTSKVVLVHNLLYKINSFLPRLLSGSYSVTTSQILSHQYFLFYYYVFHFRYVPDCIISDSFYLRFHSCFSPIIRNIK